MSATNFIVAELLVHNNASVHDYVLHLSLEGEMAEGTIVWGLDRCVIGGLVSPKHKVGQGAFADIANGRVETQELCGTGYCELY